jgi:23S rRNA (cytosine1962-C5)-methyltransferase
MIHPARLILNKGVRHRILAGHPWVFAGEVERIEGRAEDGGTVEVRSARGEGLGSAIYNSRSQIVARRYATELIPLDAGKVGGPRFGAAPRLVGIGPTARPDRGPL